MPFSSKNGLCDIGKNTPKSYGKCPSIPSQFFFLWMASLIMAIMVIIVNMFITVIMIIMINSIIEENPI